VEQRTLYRRTDGDLAPADPSSREGDNFDRIYNGNYDLAAEMQETLEGPPPNAKNTACQATPQSPASPALTNTPPSGRKSRRPHTRLQSGASPQFK